MSDVAAYEKMKDSGIEWIGNIPSHWRIHTLYQLVTQVREKNRDLQEKIDDVDSVEGVQDIAREELGLVDPDTIVIQPETE